MLKYVSLMVLAYCNATGKTEEAALKDLAIDSFVGVKDLDKNISKELLAMIPTDRQGILAWAREAAAGGNHVEQ